MPAIAHGMHRGSILQQTDANVRTTGESQLMYGGGCGGCGCGGRRCGGVRWSGGGGGRVGIAGLGALDWLIIGQHFPRRLGSPRRQPATTHINCVPCASARLSDVYMSSSATTLFCHISVARGVRMLRRQSNRYITQSTGVSYWSRRPNAFACELKVRES